MFSKMVNNGYREKKSFVYLNIHDSLYDHHESQTMRAFAEVNL